MENVTISYENDFTEKFGQLETMMWTILFAFVSIAGAIGNSVVVWIVLAHKNMRNVTNLFLLNLAIADGLVASLTIPFVSFQLIYGNWPFGAVLCKLNEYISSTSICVSVLSLSMIAIERYSAIMNPFKLRMGRGKTITIIICMWIVSSVITLPDWFFVHVSSENEICDIGWPDVAPKFLYWLFFMIITYFLPLSCITYSYIRVGIRLWSTETIGEPSENQLQNISSKKKIVKMMIMVLLIFTICWLPLHLYFICEALNLLVNVPEYIDTYVYLTVFWFAMSNSMYNPMVYYWMNARFRAGFRKAFRWCPFIKYTM